MTEKFGKNVKRIIVKSITFLSSYFPLYCMLLVMHFDKYNSKSKIQNKLVLVFVSVMVLTIMVSLFSIFLIKIAKGNKPLVINQLERPDDTIISYMMTYIVPIVTVDFNDIGSISVNVLLFLLIGYLYVRLNLLYLNPLWALAGYFSYRTSTDVIIITNIKYSKLKRINELRGIYIANDIFVAQKKNNVY